MMRDPFFTFLTLAIVMIFQTSAFTTLPTSINNNAHLNTATWRVVKASTSPSASPSYLKLAADGNLGNDKSKSTNPPSKNLYSLLDEAVLLHSRTTTATGSVTSNDGDSNKDIQMLVEEIAHVMHNVEYKPKNNIKEQKRTVNDVRNELDKAVVHLQTLSLQDDEKKWTHTIEQLATEYHELISLESSLAPATSTSMFTKVEEEKSPSLTVVFDEPNVSSMEDMIEMFESKLEKLHQTRKESNSQILESKNLKHIVTTGDNMQLIMDTNNDEDNSSNPSEGNVDSQDDDIITSDSSVAVDEQDECVSTESTKSNNGEKDEVEEVDIAIIGAGIGGLCAGSILNTLYGKKVGIYESHYLPGGCAHAFPATAIIEKGSKKEKVSFTFDSGPTIVLGCSTEPYNPLRQVLNAVGVSDEVEWIPYQGWGMVENPSRGKDKELRWPVELGPDLFETGPLLEFGGEDAVKEFQDLRKVTKGLVSGAVEIPAMAMRGGDSALIPLLRYLPALSGLIAQGEEVTQGTFGQFMDGPKFEVKNQWLRDWLDALAFSLSGLPACRTAAAAMAYVIYDMHREGAALDYPKGGLGAVIDALVKAVEQGSNGSAVHLRQHVDSIDTSPDGSFIKGLTLKNGKKIVAKDGVICNAPVWSLNKLVKNSQARMVLNNALPIKKRSPRQTWTIGKEKIVNKINYVRPTMNEGDEDSLLAKCDSAEMTGSFLHLHLALDAKDLDLDAMEAHYTVMDRGLSGDGSVVDDYSDGPCGELNMIAVSNPCVLDRSLAPPGYVVVHAYGAGNEPYGLWEGMDRKSKEYKQLKEARAAALWRAVESIIPDVKDRTVLSMIGSPITHERFLRRPKGTYGASTEDYLKDGSTPFERLKLCGDGVFPGIGIPAVALSGASAANSMVSPWKQWKCLDALKSQKLI